MKRPNQWLAKEAFVEQTIMSGFKSSLGGEKVKQNVLFLPIIAKFPLSPLVWQLHLFLSGKSQLARRRPMQSHSARVYTTHVMSAGILHFILKMHCNILSVCTFLGSGV